MKKKKINLFWSNPPHLKNFGDELSPMIVKKLSGQEIRFIDYSFMMNTFFENVRLILFYIKHLKFNRIINLFLGHWCNKLIAIGSIIDCSDKRTIVWGAGIMDRNVAIAGGRFIAVRGPLTQHRLQQLGFDAPKVIGDPALLLRRLFRNNNTTQGYELGIIPHFLDYTKIKNDIFLIDNPNCLLINVKDDSIKVINQICSCKKIISSSLHGLIVSHTYSIPAIWCKFSDFIGGDGSKFEDYFLSVEITPYKALKMNIQGLIKNYEDLFKEYVNVSLPSSERIDKICDDLLSVAPFSINSENDI